MWFHLRIRNIEKILVRSTMNGLQYKYKFTGTKIDKLSKYDKSSIIEKIPISY